MAAPLTMTPYVRVPPPDDMESYKRYVEEEMRKLEKALREVQAAILQLQTGVTTAVAFPIVLP